MDRKQNERALIEGWRAGDRAAFDELMKQFEGRLMSYLMRMARGREEAEDLFQETFLKVFEHREKIPEDAPFDYFLLRIARNLTISKRRRHDVEKRSIPGQSVRIEDGADPSVSTERQEQDAAIQAAMSELEEDERETVALKIWGGMNWRQIGELLGFSEDTASRRFAGALKILSKKLGPALGEAAA